MCWRIVACAVPRLTSRLRRQRLGGISDHRPQRLSSASDAETPAQRSVASPRRGGLVPVACFMSEQPQRPNPPDPAGSPPSAPPSPEAIVDASTDFALGGTVQPTDDTPTIISKVQPRPNVPDPLFSGILRGRKLAHFELIEPIGVGGMAAVLRARDTQLDRFVALKILPPEMAADPENVAPLPPGSPRRRQARPREHRPRLLLRRGPGPALHRLRVRRGRQPADRPRPPRPAAGAGGAALHAAGRHRAGARGRARRRPPRHQAVEHHHHAPTAGPSSWTWGWPATSARRPTAD